VPSSSFFFPDSTSADVIDVISIYTKKDAAPLSNRRAFHESGGSYGTGQYLMV